MNENIKKLKDYFIHEKGHHAYRQKAIDPYLLANEFKKNNTPDLLRAKKRLLYVLENEKPVVFKDERIAFMRTVPVLPELFTKDEVEELRKSHWLHEQGEICNINVDYSMLLNTGFDAKREELKKLAEQRKANGENDKAEYLLVQEEILGAVQNLADRYKEEAIKVGNRVVADTLSRVPAKAPQDFLDALQMFRIIHYTMWAGHNYHNTVGRFDQYMYPYFAKDYDSKIYDEDSALELLEEFFLTFNRDSDLYTGMQQGDNGQSMVLGGLNQEGQDTYNKLSELCLKASLELKLIDPKINLRVNKNTPLSTYILGSKLTKQGLGFPQYSNDEVVIPALLKWGYAPEDAYNYVVAACWEFIVPGKALDIPNIEAVSFAKAISDATFDNLMESRTYEEFLDHLKDKIVEQVDAIEKKLKNLYSFPAPFMSLMTDGCVEKATDISKGVAKYNNYGLHGTGIATCADSLEAIDRYIFKDKSITKEHLIKALEENFDNDEDLLTKLRYHTPKMGCNDDSVDNRAIWIVDTFAKVLEGRKNEFGGIYRAGTGSAMYYVWHADGIPATADGRRKGENLGANYSPSLFIRSTGPVSIVKSFAKPHLEKACNGGPLTIEFHDTVFRNDEAIEKVAMLVKSFMDLGGHQLQLNTVNLDTLNDAQLHPENYKNLIVRVWGWSGYFVELDKCYQDHIKQRIELAVE